MSITLPNGTAKIGAPPPTHPSHPRSSVWLAPTSVLFIAGLYFLVPLVWLVVNATKSSSEVSNTFGLWFAGNHGWENLKATFTYSDGIYLRWLANSVLYAGVGALFATLISALAGFALAKYEFRGKGVVFTAIMAGVLIPGSALALPLFLMLSGAQLTNSVWAVLLPSMINPFGVYLGRVYASASVPDDLLEAARLDGASDIRFFFTVAVPMMAPALVTIFLFQFVSIWNNFVLPLVMLVDPRLFPVTVGLYNFMSLLAKYPELLPVMLMGVLISVLPQIAAFLLLQRFWRSGLSAGAVKS